MRVLLCDVGGTHIRFGLSMGQKIENIRKFRVDEFDTLDDAIGQYLLSGEKPDAFYLATAARFDGSKWIFTNENKWQVIPATLEKKFSFKTIRCLNDFEASALSIIVAEESELLPIVRTDKKIIPEESRCIIGVGTGLGLAYLIGGFENPVVQQTYGGHMLPTILTQEHAELYKFITDKKNNDTIAIFEDVLSGTGLYRIYQFLCAQSHLDADYRSVSDLFERGKDNEIFRSALDIFFEILGLFAHQAVAFGYSYSGLYFTGGIIDRLMVAGLFGKEKFLQGFYQNNIPIVKKNVLSTPIYWIKDEFISLKGLLYLAEKENA